VDTFVANGNRYNMLHSVILDLFEHIRKDDSKILLKYLVASFWDQLVKFENLRSIRALKVGYDQLVEIPERISPIMLVPKKRVDLRALENEEDFSDDGSDEDLSAVVSMAKGKSVRSVANCPSSSTRAVSFVDYEDDKEEKEYKLPPKKQILIDNMGKETDDIKRKSVQKPEILHIKKQRLLGHQEGRDSGLFATICSSFSNNKTSEFKSSINCSGEEKEKEAGTSTPLTCTESLQGSSTNNRQLPLESSPKMS
jgi:protein phosphatase-4 regulatory subunit 3